ncbi:zinc ribbon domain-containing protein [bacterium]|nr:zinc ribbon domain-containing protein [bacterium]
MPTYDYICDKCGHEFEAFESITADPQKHCPKCDTDNLRRKIGPGAAILFKGSGFYITDYRSDSYNKAAKADSSSSASSSKSSDSGSSSSSSSASSSSSSSSASSK